MRRTGASPGSELKNFTNREGERAIFDRLLAVPAGARLPLVMFYGVGGVGKSWLIRKARLEWLPETLPSARLDYDPSVGARYQHDSAAALAEIRRQLKVACPRFDLAYAMMRHKQGAGDEPLLKSDGAAGTAWELVTEGLSAATSSIPGGNFIVWAVKKVGGAIHKRLKESGLDELLSGDGDQEFFELRRMDPQELHATLPERLARDLKEKLPTPAGQACQAVVFLDTFEALAVGILSESQQYEREKWIGDLYAGLSNVLLIVAGRDRLTWEEFDADWHNPANLEQHLLGGLSEHDARQFLERCGITAAPLQQALLAASTHRKGTRRGSRAASYHPFSLGLCADTVVAERERGIETDPASFALSPGDAGKLAQRFLKSLADAAHEVWIRYLALTPRFDETAARAAFSPVHNAAQDAAWNGLMDYSFVVPAETPDWWTLHTRMQEALLSRQTGALAKQQAQWRDHWQSRSQSSTDEFAALAWYHHFQMDPVDALEKWNTLAVTARTAIPPRMTDHLRLLDWWSPTGIEGQRPANPLVAAALDSFGVELWRASLGNRSVNLRRAVACLEAALHVRTENGFPVEWAATQNHLGLVYLDLPYDTSDATLQAIACFESALRVYTEKEFPIEWASTQDNLGAACFSLPSGDRAANLQRAIACYQAALRVRTEQAFPRVWAATHNNLGIACAELPTGDRVDNLLFAIACYNAALRVYTEHAYPIEWAGTQNNLGNAYYDIPSGDRAANLQRAIACYEAALRVHTEQEFPIQHGHAQIGLGSSQQGLGNARAAREHFEKAARSYAAAGLPPEWEWRAHAEAKVRELEERSTPPQPSPS